MLFSREIRANLMQLQLKAWTKKRTENNSSVKCSIHCVHLKYVRGDASGVTMNGMRGVAVIMKVFCAQYEAK